MKTRLGGTTYNCEVHTGLAGRTALVTGGANGIGLEVVRVLRDSGATVWLADLERENPAAAAAAEKVNGVAIDVTDPASIARAFDAAGGVDIVIANAGIGSDGALDETTQEQWNRTLSVNLSGAFYTVQESARRMKPRRSGSIVITASTNSFDGERWLSAYNATKHGVMGIVHTAANELGPYGIRVNAVCPGYIRTRLNTEGFADPNFMREYTRHLPLGRGGEPVEVAHTIAFLASPLASFVTGAHLFVDGGQMAAKFGTWNDDIGVFSVDHWELK